MCDVWEELGHLDEMPSKQLKYELEMTREIWTEGIDPLASQWYLKSQQWTLLPRGTVEKAGQEGNSDD